MPPVRVTIVLRRAVRAQPPSVPLMLPSTWKLAAVTAKPDASQQQQSALHFQGPAKHVRVAARALKCHFDTCLQTGVIDSFQIWGPSEFKHVVK